MKARKKVYFFEVEVRYEGNAPFPRTDRLRRWADKALSDYHHAPPCKSRLIRKNGKQAFLIKALWESLQSPHWNKDDLHRPRQVDIRQEITQGHRRPGREKIRPHLPPPDRDSGTE